ncbi:MAG TPA: MarR family transcriptional regulator [Herpetosiphonaceae bacterium]
MSSPETPDSERLALAAALKHAVRENSTAAVMVHSALSARMGLSVIEEKTLGLLEQRGPLTAGEIAAQTGLAAASVTSLIDRLERKQFAQRMRDSQDRRRVLVAINHERLAAFAPLFGGLERLLDELIAGYSAAELAVILDFVRRATSGSFAELGRMGGESAA